MKKPRRRTLLAGSMLALCTASSAALLTPPPAPAGTFMCEYGCSGRYDHCLELGGEEPLCWARYEACLAEYNCP